LLELLEQQLLVVVGAGDVVCLRLLPGGLVRTSAGNCGLLALLLESRRFWCAELTVEVVVGVSGQTGRYLGSALRWMSSLFSCGAMTPQARRSRRAGNASDRPRATIQRPASSGGMRRGASSASRLCDLADKCENLTTGSSGLPSIGSRAPLSPLAVNSPPTCTPTDETVCPPQTQEKSPPHSASAQAALWRLVIMRGHLHRCN
jgi:hypothetical protein